MGPEREGREGVGGREGLGGREIHVSTTVEPLFTGPQRVHILIKIYSCSPEPRN